MRERKKPEKPKRWEKEKENISANIGKTGGDGGGK